MLLQLGSMGQITHTQKIGHSPGAGLAIQPILQNGLERRVGPGVDLLRTAARGIKSVRAELIGQADHTETSPIPLFGVLAITHHDFGEDGDVPPDAGGARRYALWRPIFAELVVRRHVIAQRRMLSVAGGAHMGGDTLPDMEDFDGAGGEARPQIFLQQLIGH
jgi:hypothetical protein